MSGIVTLGVRSWKQLISKTLFLDNEAGRSWVIGLAHSLMCEEMSPQYGLSHVCRKTTGRDFQQRADMC